MVAYLLPRFSGGWVFGPGVAELEEVMVQWVCSTVVGYPQGSPCGGFLTSGGSEALLSALLCARRVRFGEDLHGQEGRPHFGRGIVYITELTHHAVIKGAVLAGLPKANVRVVAAKPRGSVGSADSLDLLKASPLEMDPHALEEAILRDKDAGDIPFMVVATCGTTSVGCVDDMEGIAAVAQSHGLWMHVDGAYGGFLAGLTD
eukprot:RCo028660